MRISPRNVFYSDELVCSISATSVFILERTFQSFGARLNSDQNINDENETTYRRDEVTNIDILNNFLQRSIAIKLLVFFRVIWSIDIAML